MRFTTWDGRTVEYSDGTVTGDDLLVEEIHVAVLDGDTCGCNYWAERPADISSDWRAYLTICGTLKRVTGLEPSVDRVPPNPDGYVPEGPVLDTETVQASGRFLGTGQ